MIGILLVAAVGAFVYYLTIQVEKDTTPISTKVGNRLERLWRIAQVGMQEKKYLRAEKALLTILKLDQKNVAAYNRLGILYSRQKEYKDAIECFEIASSIEPSASSLHNLGLIYFETENYEKAELAFESALNLEDDLAARHIAYAKVLEKTHKHHEAVESLKKAVELEPNAQTLQLLADLYVSMGENGEATKILAKKEKLIVPTSKASRIKRSPNRVIY